MPQGPQNLPAQVAGTTRSVALKVATDGGLIGAGARGTASLLNITVPTVVKAAPGSLVKVSVVVAGTAPGAAYDQTTVNAPAPATQIAAIPNTAGAVLSTEWPCFAGILVVPGTGQTLAVSYT